MKLRELRTALDRLVAEDNFRDDAEVYFGPNMEPVEGGKFGKGPGGLTVLNLAPIKLDKVGGF